MKGIATVFLAVLCLSPAFVKAAERKVAQEPSATVTAKALAQKLDLNRVSHDELVGVPGIGPRLAQQILDLRTKKGSFKRIEELLEVTGIKEKKLASIAGYIEVVPLQPAPSASAAPSAQSR